MESLNTNEPKTTGVDEQYAKEFLIQIGKRVQKARYIKGMSRQVLSERSGISQRYLAHLESGTGNMSVSLLLKASVALSIDIELLVGKEDPWSSKLIKMMNLYKNASKENRKLVKEILKNKPSNNIRANRIALIGLRGAGKSTLGALVSKKLDMNFVEVSEQIEQESGLSTMEVMGLYGIEGYRNIEKRILENIASHEDAMIVAVPGGIVSTHEMFDYLLRHYHTIWLQTTPEEHMSRVRAQGDERPMANNPNALSDLQNILTSRENLYSKANYTIDTSDKSIDESLNNLTSLIYKKILGK